MKQSVILSTYNQAVWLEKALHGYLYQTFTDFELLIADDGSDARTKAVIETFSRSAHFPVHHIWHADEGFQKTRILNKAILETTADYLVFSDGDCIPHPEFLESHARQARQGHFLSGGYCKLPAKLSMDISADDIRTRRAFKLGWLRARGLRGFSKCLRIGSPSHLAPLLDACTPTKATWNGHNASGWKSDILAVNGFNEAMQYGGEDREMGERLVNLGILGRGIRHQAVTLHLDHSRGYVKPEMIEKNLAIREHTRKSRSTWTANGIHKRPQG